MAMLSAVNVPPAVRFRPAGSSLSRRLVGAMVALLCGTILGIAAWLSPSPDGIGTHRQIIGMPQCGWINMMDCPCPTCGMTTAFAHTAEGRLVSAFRAQPLGALLAVLTAMSFLVGLHAAFTGSRAAAMFKPLLTPRLGWIAAGAVMLAWAYKVLSYKGLI